MDHRSLRKSYPLKSLEQSIWHWGILAISALLSGLIADSSFAQDHVENITFNKDANVGDVTATIPDQGLCQVGKRKHA